MTSPPAKNSQPTRVRFGVLAFVCSLAMITYLDRVCFGHAAPIIISELGLSGIGDLKWAMTAFVFAYGVFEIPSGWMGDVFGPRVTLIRIVLLWSIFTALTALVGISWGTAAFGLGTLICIRFLFGAGEAGAFPNLTRALHNWFPAGERGMAQGLMWMSGRIAGGLTPLIWTILVAGTAYTPALMSWRGAFILFGSLGLVWCIAFAWWFRDKPADKPELNDAERALIAHNEAPPSGHERVPWGSFLRSKNVWLLCLMYFCVGYGWYFNISYLPSFLKEQYGVQDNSLLGALYKGGPLWFGAVGCLVGGWFTDWYIRRTGDQRLGRRLMGMTGHVLCGTCYCGAIFARDALSVSLLISLAAFFNDLTLASAWATCQDIGRRYAAITAAIMNTVGSLGAAATGWLIGDILQTSVRMRAETLSVTVEMLSKEDKNQAMLSGYHINFICFAVVFGIASICWWWMDPTQPVVKDPDAQKSATP